MADNQNLEILVRDLVREEIQKLKEEIEKAKTEEPTESRFDKNLERATSGLQRVGVDAVLDNILDGRKFSTRRLATSAANQFKPILDDYFKSSSSQIGDQLSQLFGSGSRNS